MDGDRSGTEEHYPNDYEDRRDNEPNDEGNDPTFDVAPFFVNAQEAQQAPYSEQTDSP